MPVATVAVPIEKNGDGVLRVGGTRVTLDTLVTAFLAGATAEEIELRYPSLKLADIYSAISYYLQNQADVEAYLQQRQQEKIAIREQNVLRFKPTDIRSRLLKRQASQ